MTVINQGNSDSNMKTWLLATGGVVTLFGVAFCVLSCVVPVCQGAAGWLAAVYIIIVQCNAERNSVQAVVLLCACALLERAKAELLISGLLPFGAGFLARGNATFPK